MESINRPQKGSKLTLEEAMNLAVAEAYQGAVFASPNPLVGCVILDQNDRYLASGFHERCGGPHAEVVAIKDIHLSDLNGAHMIVTLEPCAHEGRTPSCAKMLAQLPIKKVTYGLIDPNPLVSGQGINILREAGKEVRQYSETSQLKEVCEVFLWNQTKKKPFVSLKIATSLDGKMGLRNGESQWITGHKARTYSHYLRATHDAIMIGIGTLLMDNPSLTIRDYKTDKKNKIVILDSTGKCLQKVNKLKLFKEHDPSNIFIFISNDCPNEHQERAPETLNILRAPLSSKGRLDLNWILTSLYEKKICSLFLEGGSKLASEFISANLINRLYLFQAPCLIGGEQGVGWTDYFKINHLSEKKVLENLTIKSYEPDFLVTGIFNSSENKDRDRL